MYENYLKMLKLNNYFCISKYAYYIFADQHPKQGTFKMRINKLST